jgi:hypothetical protein
MLVTQNLSEVVAVDELSAAGTPLMDQPRLIHQPTISNKLSCGWTSLIRRASPPARNGARPLRDKIKVDRWRFNV